MESLSIGNWTTRTPRRMFEMQKIGADPAEDYQVNDSQGKPISYHAAGYSMPDQRAQNLRQVPKHIIGALGGNEDSQFGPALLGGSQTELGEDPKEIMVGEILRLQDELGYANALQQTSGFSQICVAGKLGFQVMHRSSLLKKLSLKEER